MSWNSATARHLGRSHATCKRYNLLSPTWKCIMRHLLEGIRCQCMCNQRFLALGKLLEGTEWDYCSIWASRISLPAHIASAEKSRIFEVHQVHFGNKCERLCFAVICCLYVAVLTNWYMRTCVSGSVPNPPTTWEQGKHCYFKIRFLCSLCLRSLLHLVNLLHKNQKDTHTTRSGLLICNWRLCCCLFSCPLPKVK